MTLATLIVDDEPIARARMRALCTQLADKVHVIGEAVDGTQALEAIRSKQPQLILLDVAMPNLDGIGVAEAMAPLQAPPVIIFCTAHADHALDAFAVSAADYLLKPIGLARLGHAIDRATKLLGDTRPTIPPDPWLDHLWVPHRGAMVRVGLSEVARIDAEGDYVRLVTSEANYLLHVPLSRLIERLDPNRFMRVRRSTVVRTDQLRAAHHHGGGTWSIELFGGTMIRVGPTYWKALKASLSSLGKLA